MGVLGSSVCLGAIAVSNILDATITKAATRQSQPSAQNDTILSMQMSNTSGRRDHPLSMHGHMGCALETMPSVYGP